MTAQKVSDNLISLVLQRKPMHKKFLLTALQQLSPEESDDAENFLNFMFQNEQATITDLADAYLTIVEDTFKEELFFRETGHYRNSSYQEVAKSVYHEQSYMWRYMVGLAISTFWWINHVKLRRFFLKCITGKSGKLYYEVGPGHGLYFLDAMKNSFFEHYKGIDISATSVALTRRIIESGFFGSFSKFDLCQEDFFSAQLDSKCDFLVMGEVLEHVENPEKFLDKSKSLLKDNGQIFLTTCYNSPAIDHISNFYSFSKLRNLLEKAGFHLSKVLVVPKSGFTLEKCETDKLAVNVAALLEKK